MPLEFVIYDTQQEWLDYAKSDLVIAKKKLRVRFMRVYVIMLNKQQKNR